VADMSADIRDEISDISAGDAFEELLQKVSIHYEFVTLNFF